MQEQHQLFGGAISPDILAALKEKLAEEEIEAQVAAVISEHHYLIPKSAAAVLLAARLGVLKRKYILPHEIRKGDRNFKTSGFVEKIYPPYVPGGDPSAKSVRVVICDASQKNSMTVAMWGQNARLAEEELSINDLLELDGCGFRNGEINCYAGCKASIAKKADFSSVKNLSYGLVNVRGVVSEIFQDYYYMRNGKEQYMSSFKLTQHDGSARVVAWHDPTVVKKLECGMHVSCENCLFKNNELHVNLYSRIVIHGKKNDSALECAVISVESDGGKLKVGMDKGALELEGDAALKFLGIPELPPGITIDTVASLKKNSIVGKKALCLKSGDGANDQTLAFLEFKKEKLGVAAENGKSGIA